MKLDATAIARNQLGMCEVQGVREHSDCAVQEQGRR